MKVLHQSVTLAKPDHSRYVGHTTLKIHRGNTSAATGGTTVIAYFTNSTVKGSDSRSPFRRLRVVHDEDSEQRCVGSRCCTSHAIGIAHRYSSRSMRCSWTNKDERRGIPRTTGAFNKRKKLLRQLKLRNNSWMATTPLLSIEYTCVNISLMNLRYRIRNFWSLLTRATTQTAAADLNIPNITS